jgi:chemotaxis protein MotA
LAASQTLSKEMIRLAQVPDGGVNRNARRLDRGLVAGLIIAATATLTAIAWTGVELRCFLQPTGIAVVLGGTLGVMLITTPGRALLNSVRRVKDLFSTRPVSREALIEQIVGYSRITRFGGMIALEPSAQAEGDEFLREALLVAMDAEDRKVLEGILEAKLRLKERQAETDAKALEVAGGFAPTMGILGTVIGLIDVLRQFSAIEAAGVGIGTAFVSTIYGLGLANLVLLPAAHRIRARAAETMELQELMAEGVLCLFDQLHATLIRQRLSAYLRETEAQLQPARQNRVQTPRSAPKERIPA